MSAFFTEESPITLVQANAVTSHYKNAAVEDLQPAGHFRIVIRDHRFDDKRMMWRYWNFEPGAVAELNFRLKEDGIKAD